MFPDSYRTEQLSLRSHQCVVTTVEESVLQMEMSGLESQEEDGPKCILFFKPMSWLGQIRSHRRDESWSSSLWQTFFSTSMGSQIPAITEKPFTTWDCRKFQLDPQATPLGDHLNTCTAHSGDKEHTTGWLTKLLNFFVQRSRLKHNTWLKAEVLNMYSMVYNNLSKRRLTNFSKTCS